MNLISGKLLVSALEDLPERRLEVMKPVSLKIGLISMPQSLTALPSIGLTQLASVIQQKFAWVQTDIIYACLDYVRFLGWDTYKKFEAFGLNEWLFQREAFPESDEHMDQFKKLFFRDGKTIAKSKIFDLAQTKRCLMKGFLESLWTQYHLEQYDLIGFTSVVSQNMASIAMARLIKGRKPSGIIVMGGPNCDYPMGKVLCDNVQPIDYIFSGMAVLSFTQFVACLLKGDLEGTHQIDGVFSKKNQVRDPEHPRGAAEEAATGYWVNSLGKPHDINTQLDLDYDSFLAKYDQFRRDTGFPSDPVLLFETSRGCWKRDGLPCTFCGLNTPRLCYESKQPGLAVEYINGLVAKYAGKCAVFSGVDNIMDQKYIKEVLPFLKIPEAASVDYEVRSNLSQEDLATCAKFHVNIMQPGIESLNTKVLSLIQKGVSAFTNIRFLKNCIESGVYPIWNLLGRVPAETDDANYRKLLADLPLLRHLPPPASFSPITLARFSPYFDQPEKYGIALTPVRGYACAYPFPAEDLERLANIFDNVNGDSRYIQIYNEYASRVALEFLEWLFAFRNEDAFPQLTLQTDGTILDSRQSVQQPEIHVLTPLEAAILRFLEQPHSRQTVQTELTQEAASQIEETLQQLREKQLLFEEGGSFLSLVCQNYAWNKRDYSKFTELIRLTTASYF
jgi:ribosomal peptide maturation radical SAM protein 1